jgi:hypothetical protein
VFSNRHGYFHERKRAVTQPKLTLRMTSKAVALMVSSGVCTCVRSVGVNIRALADIRGLESGVTNECQHSFHTSAHDLHPPNTLKLDVSALLCLLRLASRRAAFISVPSVST